MYFLEIEKKKKIMSFNRFVLPYTQTMEQIGVPNENAYLIFYQTDQVTQQTTYSDYLCTVPSATVSIVYNSTLVQAVQANAAGLFPTIYMPSSNTYYWVLLDKNLNTLKTENQYSVPPAIAINLTQSVLFGGNNYIGRQSIEIVGTTYTVNTATSWGNVITFNNPNPVAVTIAAPSVGAFPTGWVASFQNNGNGPVTITGGATINGSNTLVLNKGDGADISSDGTLFNAQTGTAELLYLNSGATLNVTANVVTVTNSQHLINTSSAAQVVNTINGNVIGQILVLKLSSISNSFTISNGSTIKLANGNDAILSALTDSIMLEYDAVNSWWVEISRNINNRYTSAVTSYVNGTPGSLTHGFTTKPFLIQVLSECQSTDGGYAVGDQMIISSQGDSSGNTGLSVWIEDSTTIKYVISTNGYIAVLKNGSNIFGLDATKWKLIFKALF